MSGLNASLNMDARTRDNSIQLTNGSYDLDGHRTYLESTRPTVTFTLINGALTIREQVQMLQAEVDKGRRLLVAQDTDGTLFQAWAKASIGYRSDQSFYGKKLEIRMTFTLPFPYLTVQSHDGLYIDTGWTLDDGYTLDSGNKTSHTIDSSAETFTITNGGGAIIKRGRLVFIGETGVSADSIEVINHTTGDRFTLNLAIAAGDTIELSFLPMTVTKNSSPFPLAVAIGPNQRLWMELAVGANNIEVKTTGLSGGNITMHWHHADVWIA